MQMPTPLSMSMPRPRTRPRTRPRARPMTSQGQGQGHCLRDINTQLSPFCIFSIFLVFLKRLVFCVVSVILRVRCYLHLRWHYWPHSGWFQISGVSRKVSFEVWDPTQGVLGFQGLVQSQFLVASWKFKYWCFLDILDILDIVPPYSWKSFEFEKFHQLRLKEVSERRTNQSLQ